MPNYKRISIEDRQKIIRMHQDQMSIRKISKYLDVSKTSVHRVISDWRRNGSVRPLPRRYKKKLILPYQFEKCLRRLQKEKHQTVAKFISIIRDTYGVEYSRSGLRKYMKREGVRGRIKRKKPLISNRNRLRRIIFAKQHLNWGDEEWGKVVWSDESTFELVRSRGKEYYYSIKRGWDSSTRKLTTQAGKQKVLLWGCFKNNEVGVLYHCRNTINANLYQKILKDAAFSSIDAFHCGDDFIFMQDNAPPHKARSTLQLLEFLGWKMLSWPPCSPDLNPIENLWGILKKRVYSEYYYKTLDELKDRINQIWLDLDGSEILSNLITSMPNRMKLVIKNKGHPIDY